MAKEDKTNLTEPTQEKQTNIEEMFATLQKSYDEKLDKLIKAHEEEIQTIKDENKKIIQGIVAGRFNPPAETQKEDEAENEEYDENDMSIEAQQERTKKELLKRFNFIKKKK